MFLDDDEVEYTKPWEEIGSREKPDGALFRIPESPIPNHKHEDQSITAKRTAKNLEAIFKVMPESKIHGTGLVECEARGKKFDMYPSTDCYFIYSTGKYGTGIQELCEKIKTFLEMKKD